MSGSIDLYDFSHRNSPNRCWSFNVWKTRLALNYKGIPYTTKWVDHNTLKPTLSALGVPPDTSGQGFEYTVPTVRLPDGSMMSESANIAAKLEELWPSPTLRLNKELQAEADRVVLLIAMPLFPIYMPRLARDIIPHDTVDKFVASREKRFGKSFKDWESTEGGEAAWEAAAPGFAALKELLNNHKTQDGPFILGKEVCYADLILLAVFQALKSAGEDLFSRLTAWDDCFGEFYQHSQEWVHNDQ